jgi:hypothetical protein
MLASNRALLHQRTTYTVVICSHGHQHICLLSMQALKKRLPPPPKVTLAAAAAAAAAADAASGDAGSSGSSTGSSQYISSAEYVMQDELLKVC